MLAAGFAYSMKVETKLARNANSEAELEWLGRSGVEYARWVLANSLFRPHAALRFPRPALGHRLGLARPHQQPRRRGPEPVHTRTWHFTWKITDLESKFNINSPEPVMQQVLPQALTLMGVAPSEQPPIVNCILDWIDLDDQTRVEGAETEYYQGLNSSLYGEERPD